MSEPQSATLETALLALLLCAALDYDSVIVDLRPLETTPQSLATEWWDRYPNLMGVFLGPGADPDALGWERVNAGIERLTRDADLLRTEGGPVPSSSGWARLSDAHHDLVGGAAQSGDWLEALKTRIEERWPL